MNRFSLYLRLSAFICGLFVSSASAAPPTITYLSPAGAQRGTSVEVTAAGTIDASTKVWVSGKGVTVEPAKRGRLKVTVAKDAVPGTYWLRAYNAEGASALRPFIVGMLPEVAEKESNDDTRKPQAIEGSVVVNGKLEKNGDVDCFAVKLKKGETLVASLEAHNTLRSPMDAILQIVSADGFVVAENNDFHGLDPQIAYTAKADGTHIARVYAFPSQPDSSIRFFGSDACVYRLTLTTGPFADYAMPLAVSAEGKPEVEAQGWNLTPEARKLSLVMGDDDFATAYGANFANPLRVRLEPHATYGPKIDSPLAPPFSATGRIENSGGEALFTIDAKKGEALTLQVESQSLGLAVNPVVRVLDQNKKQLAKAEPGKLNTDTALAFTPAADGRYAVAVRDLFAGGGKRHVFLLRVVRAEPDYDLTVAADRFTITPGTPTTIPVNVNRKNGFKMPVEITAEGLPEGAKIEVKPPAKGKSDPNTVTVLLTASEPWSGPFRLVGHVKDEPKLRRTTHAAVTGFDETASDLWLTVRPEGSVRAPLESLEEQEALESVIVTIRSR